MKKSIYFGIIFLLFIAFCGKSGENNSNSQSKELTLEQLLPDTDKLNIEMQDEARTFDSNNLWEYINGAADNFLMYGFQKVITAEYKSKEGDTEFVLDIYKMQDVKNGYGIYASERSSDAEIQNFGDEGYLGGGSLIFWANKYYIKIISYDDSEVTNNIITKVANDIAGKISKSKDELKILSWFPETNIKRNSKRYFAKDILGLEFLVNGYMAEYQENNSTSKVYLIDCSVQHDASEKLNSYKNYIKESGTVKEDKISIGEDGFTGEDRYYGNVSVVKIKDFILIILGYKNQDFVTDIFGAINQKI